MTEETKRVGIGYCSKFITIQGKNQEESIAHQQKSISQYAKREGIVISKMYGGVNFEEKTTQTVLQESKCAPKNSVDFLLLYSTECVGHIEKGNSHLIIELMQRAKTVISVSENTTSDAKHMVTLLKLLTNQALNERKNIQLQIANERREKVLHRKSFDGSYLPIGYTKGKFGDTERLFPATKENTFNIEAIQELWAVEHMFYSYLEGLSLRKIAKKLGYSFGLTRRKTSWSHKSVSYVLTNPVYVGRLRGVLENSESYTVDNANIEPIMNPLLFESIQKQIKFKRTGGKSLLSRSPLHTLCLRCASPLIRKSGRVICENCDVFVSASVLSQALSKQFKKIVEKQVNENILNVEKVENEIVERYEWKQKKLKIQLSEIIRHLEGMHTTDNFNKQSEGKENKLNHEEKERVQKELNSVNEILNVINAKRQVVQEEKCKKFESFLSNVTLRLVRLSYIVLVDFDENEIEVAFYNDLFDKKKK